MNTKTEFTTELAFFRRSRRASVKLSTILKSTAIELLSVCTYFELST